MVLKIKKNGKIAIKFMKKTQSAPPSYRRASAKNNIWWYFWWNFVVSTMLGKLVLMLQVTADGGWVKLDVGWCGWI